MGCAVVEQWWTGQWVATTPSVAPCGLTGIFFDLINDCPWGGLDLNLPCIGTLPGLLVAVSSSESSTSGAEGGLSHGSGV